MKQLNFLLIYIFFVHISSILFMSYSIDYDVLNISILAKVLFFDRFTQEFIITLLLLMMFTHIQKKIAIASLYVFTISLQLISFMISGEFLTKLAIDNVEFISLMINYDNVIIVSSVIFGLVVLPFIIVMIVVKKTSLGSTNITKYAIMSLLLLVTIIQINHKLIPTNIIKEREHLYEKNHLSHTAPIQALVKIFKSTQEKELNFSIEEIKRLEQLGYSFNYYHQYPLMKDDFNKNSTKTLKHSSKKQNLIIIFTEGLSARTTSIYSDKYPNLTPNLKDFADNNQTMVVDNFFNHTAATYRGLQGQLCSIFPLFGGGEGIDKISKIDYKCLPHILKNNGYKNSYLNMHSADDSKNEELVANFGYDEILMAEQLSKTYLDKTDKFIFLKDAQSYNILTNYLKTNTVKKPFSLSLYTIETHAWVDIDSNGVKYLEGKNNTLNTIHNMDASFGRFWNYFKNSPYYKDTIVIFTSDHAHFNESSYIKLMSEYKEKDYKKIFIDKVPLLIYSPATKLPKSFDASSATSLDIAPTIIQLLNIKDEPNSFVGTSIFQKQRDAINIASLGDANFMIKDNIAYEEHEVKEEDKADFALMKKFISYTQKLEKSNQLYEKK